MSLKFFYGSIQIFKIVTEGNINSLIYDKAVKFMVYLLNKFKKLFKRFKTHKRCKN